MPISCSECTLFTNKLWECFRGIFDIILLYQILFVSVFQEHASSHCSLLWYRNGTVNYLCKLFFKFCACKYSWYCITGTCMSHFNVWAEVAFMVFQKGRCLHKFTIPIFCKHVSRSLRWLSKELVAFAFSSLIVYPSLPKLGMHINYKLKIVHVYVYVRTTVGVHTLQTY